MVDALDPSELDAVLQQARRLQTAYSVVQVIHGLDIDEVLSGIAESLVEVGGFAAANVCVKVTRERLDLDRSANYGTVTTRDPLSMPLVVHAESFGQLELWLAADADADEAQELVDYVVPTLTTALHRAITFIEIHRWREALERKVEERTAELQTANEKLADSFSKLESAKAARDRIFANINHEVRTPLSLVVLATDDLRRGGAGALPDAARVRLDGIDSNVRRLLQLVDGLLLLAAGDEGKLRIRPALSDLADVMRRTAEMWAIPASRVGVELSFVGPEQCPGTFDESAIERVVTNLVSNAVKFTPEGGSIRLELDRHGEEYVIRVRDTGRGIDENLRSRLFGRFEQGGAAVNRISSGSGIGLSIVKELVEAHGGRVAVEANPGGGSVFVLVIPVHATGSASSSDVASADRLALPASIVAPLAEIPRAAEASVYVVECKRTPAATVLVAEDNPALAAEVANILCDEYRVVVASDGLAALEAAREDPPDLLVTDVAMPRMDGYELTRQFLAVPGLQLAPVILLTSRADLRERMSGFGAGAVDHISKPFEADDLRARVRSQLLMRKMALRLHDSEKLAAMGILSAGMAHELRNPANGVVNAIEPLKSLLPDDLTSSDSATGQLLEVIETCASQLAILTKQLLGLGRPGEMRSVEVTAHDLIKQVTGILRAQLQKIDLRVEIEAGLKLVCAPPMILQVLTNLLENGAHAAGDGGWVRVVGRRERDRVVLRISDSGPGVPPGLRSRIFDPFFTTKAPGVGTGLGLPTSRRIVERHLGSLTLESGSSGACFVIDLPARGPDHIELPTTWKATNAG